MKRILLTTTSLVLAAGVAQAEVTFSGKAEAGVSRTEKVIGSAATFTGTVNTYTWVDGVLTKAAGTTAADASTLATATSNHNAKLVLLEAAKITQQTTASNATAAARDTAADNVAIAEAAAAITGAILADQTKAAVAAVAAGDMKAYSGYDMDVAVSSTLDNGMELSAAFDMGAGNIADRDDDRVLDAQPAAVALSAVTIKNGGVTYVVGQNKVDDLYDDTQNGDVSVSGAMGGISYTLVADLDKDTKAVAASTTYTTAAAANVARSGDTSAVALADGSAAGAAVTTKPAIGDSDYTNASVVSTAATAAVYESTSLSLSGAAGGVDWTFTTTNKNDRGNAASKVSLGYAAGDALSFTLTHDTQGKREAINTLKASYTMDAITLTASMADDKNHAGNTNTGSKASQNLTIAYANGPLTASFNNDESSAWWATTSYDLGNGADIFATVDHQEFAVVGLTFAF
ncbi:hypothetical protein N9D58_00730 [Planktomarina temperata]|nr:hypothetical protein [Planktomarina temperata]